jgi:phenylacetate-coenzyme A ligase PaaK-like adenylate-forming protein
MLEAELLERDRWSRDDLMAYQEERARALIAHAVSKSPYYREALGADAAERPTCRAADTVEGNSDG